MGHLLVQLRPLARMGFRYQPRIEAHDPEARHALILMAPRAIGLGAAQITFIVVTSLATLLGAGAVSDFNFAFAMLQIPLGIIGVPLGIVVLPTLSREAAQGNESAFASLLTRALRLLIYVMVPISVLTAVARQPFVEILFGSGKISQSNLDLIALTLGYFLIGLTAHALIAVLARAFYARQDTATPVVAAVAAVAINTTLAIVLVGPLGLGGIALAIAIAAWVEALALIVVLSRRLPLFPLAGMGRVAMESVAGSLAAGAVAYVVLRVTGDWLGPDASRLLLLVQVTVVGLGFGLVYAAISVALRIPELPTIVGVMADALRRPRRA
jgi:putative peptidoglycan lipid II flippase